MAQSRIATLLFKLLGDNSALVRTMRDTESRTKAFHKNITRVGAAIGLTFGARQLFEFGKQVTELSGKMVGVRNAFERFADVGYLEQLQKATNNTTSDLVLMQQAIKAKNFRIPMDVFAKGLEFATKRANETGESIDYLINSFTTGLGRESVKILDNLNISTLELNREVKKTGDFQIAVGNIMDRELKSMGDAVDTTAVKSEQLSAAWENFSIELGTTLTPAVNVFKNVLIGTTKQLTIFFGEINKISESKSLTFWEKLIGILAPGNSHMREAIALAAEYIETEDEKMDRLRDEAIAMRDKMLAEKKANKETTKSILTYQELKDKLSELSTEKQGLTVTDRAKFAAINDETQAIQKQIKEYDNLSNIRTQFSKLELPKSQGFSLFKPITLDSSTLAPVAASLQRGFDLQKQLIRENFIDISGMVQQGLNNTIADIASGIGELASGQIGFEDFFDRVIQGFANFLKSMGAMLVAYGTAQVALEVSNNPYAMIAAGAAMIAIGAAMGALQKSSANFNGSSTGSGAVAAPAYYNPNSGYMGDNNVVVTGVIKGEDIYLTNRKYSDKLTRF